VFIFFNNPIVKKFLLGAVVFCIIAFAYVFHTQKTNMYIENIKQIELIHQEELRKINAVINEERLQREVNIAKLQSDLDDARTKYKESVDLLDKKKKVTTTALVQKYFGDPMGMATKISEITGFKVVMP
jgi:hypothetical protein